ncbi:transglycosylase domain-containing protein [Natribacillus halophilus]|uniref:Penicillin-binding protein 2A n=1 Tax=Natribacillus halophilus TaxID=549003 RepID=A0A1G8NWW9_9BACI|nr:PBP1A family penicillin-binding protein [Natribacillus halophilus]SDI84771.1 penicillin-binding protein 2A [Natribacillus halophilus]
MKRFKKSFFITIVIILSMLVIAVGGYALALISGSLLADESQLDFAETTTIVDEEGEELGRLFTEDRENASINEVPEPVQEAFLAVEDHRFYEHQGIDIWAIGRALYRDILAGEAVEGGSTLTQQLAKNVFLDQDQTLMRKTKEVLISMHLERKYSKDHILEMYLNQTYFGHGTYGISRAAETYFDKDVEELNVAEGALLAAIPKGPYIYSPASDEDNAETRRNTVLALMEQHGFIDENEQQVAEGESISSELHEKPAMDESLYTYIDMVIEEGRDRFDMSENEMMTGGYTIQLPINQQMQRASFAAMQNQDHFPGDNESVQASFVLLDHNTGAVEAIHGGRDYVRKGLNRALVSRQPGSAFKPISVFAPALASGEYKPYSNLRDEALVYEDYDDYAPQNISGEYSGSMTMRDAIVQSANAPAVWLLDQMGVEQSKEWAESAIEPFEDEGLSFALGGLSEGVSPLDMATAYTTFANDGVKSEPYFISRIAGADGEELFVHEQQQERLLSEQDAWYMTRMLEDVVDEGTGQAGDTDHALAGKTGTTGFEEVAGGNRDAWFVGYTPQYTGALWMGYDETTEDAYLEAGSAYPTNMFKSIMNNATVDQEAIAFQKPEGVEDLEAPVQLASVDDLSAGLTLQGEGFLNVELQWSTDEDERLVYNVYEVDGDEANKVGEVEGEGSYTINGANMFSLNEYMVVPYNPQTGQEGEPSNVADVHLASWL